MNVEEQVSCATWRAAARHEGWPHGPPSRRRQTTQQAHGCAQPCRSCCHCHELHQVTLSTQKRQFQSEQIRTRRGRPRLREARARRRVEIMKLHAGTGAHSSRPATKWKNGMSKADVNTRAPGAEAPRWSKRASRRRQKGFLSVSKQMLLAFQMPRHYSSRLQNPALTR